MAVPDLIFRQKQQTQKTAMNVPTMLADFLDLVTPKFLNKHLQKSLSAVKYPFDYRAKVNLSASQRCIKRLGSSQWFSAKSHLVNLRNMPVAQYLRVKAGNYGNKINTACTKSLSCWYLTWRIALIMRRESISYMLRECKLKKHSETRKVRLMALVATRIGRKKRAG